MLVLGTTCWTLNQHIKGSIEHSLITWVRSSLLEFEHGRLFRLNFLIPQSTLIFVIFASLDVINKLLVQTVSPSA
jgi:hypothetical protein